MALTEAFYIHFHAFMRSKAGNWEQLTNKIDKTFEFLYLRNKIPVRIKAGKSLDFMTIVFYPKKWFGVGERKGELKIMASYEYKKMTAGETRDTALLKIPSYTLFSDTLTFTIK